MNTEISFISLYRIKTTRYMTNTEKNIIIATTVMNWSNRVDSTGILKFRAPKELSTNPIAVSDLKFDSDWNWLMACLDVIRTKLNIEYNCKHSTIDVLTRLSIFNSKLITVTDYYNAIWGIIDNLYEL